MADTFEVLLERQEGYRFEATFEGTELAPLVLDEPPPLGAGAGPSPQRLLAAAVGSCLGSSLLFCLQKMRVEVAGLTTRVRGSTERNERNRLRLGGLEVTLTLDAPDADEAKLARCRAAFEDFCTVTASVRSGLDVRVTVADATGRTLAAEDAPPAW